MQIVAHFLTPCIQNHYREFEKSGPYLVFKKIYTFRISKASLDGQRLLKTNVNYYKVRCRLQIDIGPGTTESAVEFSSTLE